MQPDQNPDLKVQEEKPETVKKTVKKETEKKINKPKKQLTKKEREGIVSMLKNELFLSRLRKPNQNNPKKQQVRLRSPKRWKL